MRVASLGALAALVLPAGCVRVGDPPPRPSAAPEVLVSQEAPQRPGASAASPGRSLSIAEARRYMVELINRDRASAGLEPVTLDEGAATRAGQTHAVDMATHGFLGHWGTDGSVPEERFTDAGGADMVQENASCFTDERARQVDSAARIAARDVEHTESMFFHEQPPHDGHRKNILTPWHKRVGIGVAQPESTATEIAGPCFAQEFVDPYGTYAPVPSRMSVGETVHVEGTVAAPASFAGVGLARIEAPRPLPAAELNRRRTYPVPAPYQMYWPPGYQTPIPVKVSGGRFVIDLPLTDGGRPGLYELSVWATVPGSRAFVMISLRTITAR